VSTPPRMSDHEAIELVERIARTSQRMLFVPILAAAMTGRFTSSLALVLVKVAAIPLAAFYVLGSILFLGSEVRSWSVTSRELLQFRAGHSRTATTKWDDAPKCSKLYGAGDDCAVCMEPLRIEQPPEAPQEQSLQQPPPPPPPRQVRPKRVAIQIQMLNGPRKHWTKLDRRISGYLEVAIIEHETATVASEIDRAPKKTDVTTQGSWLLILSTGVLHRVKFRALAMNHRVHGDCCGQR